MDYWLNKELIMADDILIPAVISSVRIADNRNTMSQRKRKQPDADEEAKRKQPQQDGEGKPIIDEFA